MTPLERLLAATERLMDDASTAVVSACDMFWADDPGSPPGPDGLNAVTSMAKAVTEAFTVGTETSCMQADSGAKGQVAVQVPVATFPLPLGLCVAMSIVPGQLPGAPATPVTCPSYVPTGDDVVNVSINAAQAPGLYCGHVGDQSGNLKRPFLIFLDGLA